MDQARVRRTASILATIVVAAWFGPLQAATLPRVAPFRCDITPELGQPLIWTTPAARVSDPLWAKGILLENGRERYVLCAIDWCGVGGETDRLFRSRIAAAAGTGTGRVALHAVHQHTAPYVDLGAYRMLASRLTPPAAAQAAFLERVADRLAAAVRAAATRLETFDEVGTGTAAVPGVASARRIAGSDGSLVTRFSSGGKDPALAALPEGAVDTLIRTITISAAGRPIVRLHYYATHPQTFCCEGTVTGDFVSAARESLEQDERVPQVYFTGCAGDVTVGKYNDGSQEARAALRDRLYAGMKAAIASTRLAPATEIRWCAADLRLPLKTDPAWSDARLRSRLAASAADDDAYRAALSLSFTERKRPLPASALRIGPVRILHLPGEPMLEFQRYAQGLAAGDFAAIAGYGDISPGYLCTDRAFAEGGYEPGASNAGPGTEARVKEVIHSLLGRLARQEEVSIRGQSRKHAP